MFRLFCRPVQIVAKTHNYIGTRKKKRELNIKTVDARYFKP